MTGERSYPVTESAEALAQILMRCRTVLGNMALENEGAIFNRWPINHEPLRSDARNLVPLIDEALAAHHTGALKRLNDYHNHHPLSQSGPVAQQPTDHDVLAGLDGRLDRLLLTAKDGDRFILSTESAKNIVGIVREWIRSKGSLVSSTDREAGK